MKLILILIILFLVVIILGVGLGIGLSKASVSTPRIITKTQSNLLPGKTNITLNGANLGYFTSITSKRTIFSDLTNKNFSQFELQVQSYLTNLNDIGKSINNVQISYNSE